MLAVAAMMVATATVHTSAAGTWVVDTVHSPCIDAGAPADDYSLEPQPNGGRINMGAYGNTLEASKYTPRVTVDSSPAGAAIGGSHPGIASYPAFCSVGATMLLVAPQFVTANDHAYIFVKWTLDAVDAPAGLLELSFTVMDNTSAAAAYELALPSTVQDLSAAVVNQQNRLAIASAAASTVLYNCYVAGYATDGNPTTFWSSKESAAARAEQLALDLGSPQAVGKVRLLPRTGFAQLFPQAFSIDISLDGTIWTTVATETGYVGKNNVWYQKDLGSYAARYVRLAALSGVRFTGNGLYYAQVAEFEVYPPTEPAAQLAWTAPGLGAGGNRGTADVYDLRFATQPIVTQAEWEAATVVASPPAPMSVGTRQSILVSHRMLPHQARIYFAIRSAKGQNESDASNSPFVDMPADLTPPAAITDLRAALLENPQVQLGVAGASGSSVLYGWYGASLATDGSPATFWSSTGAGAPRSEELVFDLGSTQSVGLLRLLPRSGFAQLFPADFTIMTSTNGIAWSQAAAESGYKAANDVWWERNLGGVLARHLRLTIAATTRYAPNGLYYAQVAEFQAYAAHMVRLTWTAPGGDGLAGVAAVYDVRWSTRALVDAPAWDAATAVGGVPAPAAANSQQTVEAVLSLPAGARISFAIKARDAAGNESALSNSAYVDVPPGM